MDVQLFKSNGWFFFFSVGNINVGPFKNLNQADLLDVAAQLSGKTDELEELKELLERSVGARRNGDEILEWRLDSEYSDRVKTWTVHPKDVLKAKCCHYAMEDSQKRKKHRPPRRGFFPSALATCFKKRYFDVGDCPDSSCIYFQWCSTQLKAIRDGAVLVFYEKNPLKCSFCHRRLATQLLYVKLRENQPNSVFLACDNCASAIPSRWTVLQVEKLE